MQNAKSPFILPILHNNTHHGTLRGRGGLTYKWYDVFFKMLNYPLLHFVNDIVRKTIATSYFLINGTSNLDTTHTCPGSDEI